MIQNAGKKAKSFCVDEETNQIPYNNIIINKIKCQLKDEEQIQKKQNSYNKNKYNAAILEKNGQHVLAHGDQFRFRIEPEDVEMQEEF